MEMRDDNENKPIYQIGDLVGFKEGAGYVRGKIIAIEEFSNYADYNDGPFYIVEELTTRKWEFSNWDLIPSTELPIKVSEIGNQELTNLILKAHEEFKSRLKK